MRAADNLASYLTVKDAAKLLGVTPTTLRNWEKSGKLVPRRHPINRYRLYRREELAKMLEQLSESPTPKAGTDRHGKD